MSPAFRLEILSSDGKVPGKAGIAVSCVHGSGPSGDPLYLTPPCTTAEAFREAVGSLQEELEKILQEAQELLEEEGAEAVVDLPPEAAWEALSGIADEAVFMDRFNQMPEDARRQVAEHVLAHCSVFSGAGAVFSAHYDSETATLV